MEENKAKSNDPIGSHIRRDSWCRVEILKGFKKFDIDFQELVESLQDPKTFEQVEDNKSRSSAYRVATQEYFKEEKKKTSLSDSISSKMYFVPSINLKEISMFEEKYNVKVVLAGNVDYASTMIYPDESSYPVTLMSNESQMIEEGVDYDAEKSDHIFIKINKFSGTIEIKESIGQIIKALQERMDDYQVSGRIIKIAGTSKERRGLTIQDGADILNMYYYDKAPILDICRNLDFEIANDISEDYRASSNHKRDIKSKIRGLSKLIDPNGKFLPIIRDLP